MPLLRKTLALLASLALVLTLLPAALADSGTVEILFLGTSDIHGQYYATDYTADQSASGSYRQGLTRVASYVKEQRAAYKNVFLADAGDPFGILDHHETAAARVL